MSQQGTETTSIQELVNVPEVVKAFGRSYEIKKFTLGPMTQAMEYVGPVGYLLQWVNELPRGENGQPSPGDMLQLVTRAASISGPSIMGLISVATQEPIEWLEQQDAMDGLRIFAKVVEKNLDFFSEENIRQVGTMFDGLQRKIPTSGGDTSTS